MAASCGEDGAAAALRTTGSASSADGTNGDTGRFRPRPLENCERKGLQFETCIGRVWSVMEDRGVYRRGTGSVHPAICRRFVEAVPPGGLRPVDFAPHPCPYDDASRWRAITCDEVGLADRDSCFVCTGTSPTVDQFTYVQAFNAACDEATLTFGVNVPPGNIDECHRAVRREDCPNRRWYDPNDVH